MKYIKTHESLLEDNIDPFQKYSIYNSESLNEFYILRIISVSKTQVKMLKLYRTSKNDFWLVKTDTEGAYHTDKYNLLNHEVYRSDDLQDCINKLPELVTTNKFNI